MSGDYASAIPELIMAGSAMALLMVGAYGGGDARRGVILWCAAGLMAVLGIWVATTAPTGQPAFSGAFLNDRFAQFAKVLILFSSAAMLVIGNGYLERRKLMRFEYPVLILLATLGMMMMVSSGDLISLYVGLELQSLALYVVASFNRDSQRSTEAGLKYFVLGALSSGLLLYGASLIYGYTGSTNFTIIAGIIKSEGVSLGLTFGLVFVCAALAFKISAAPFHMWTPDVYEGSPTPVTAFFATAPKVAAGALFARVLYGGFGDAVHDWQQILVFVSVASMFLGAIAAIGQKNLKRLMAYSSIGHMGFALVGLAAGTEAGAQSLLFYLAIYVVMNIGVFAFILSMERDGQPVVQIADLAGLARVQPAHALAVAVLMFSLAGLPPLVGFFAKFFVFKAAVDAGLAPLALAGAIASVIGAYYYLNIVRVMYLSDQERPLDIVSGVFGKVMVGGAALAMAAGWLPFVSSAIGLTDATLAAARALGG
ncbi:NADH-quinone oxidoreductase subunit NuoN [Paralimibaculum aggregatum]|uniref:NADH-quinone oxidoreductase subunit N n=1 Tax=Paralimibaculum aggregatum TaxID=3036245 RepID=A0ABQ6LT14_9RHOB|nr:NADH-quinone oxidoreductase subunit NuoN [Limibaculum sp. NKW23]GMG85219.1 NADH-quinone oxidoreductase subunit NuoN [Limibaculum sp. NKW23]